MNSQQLIQLVQSIVSDADRLKNLYTDEHSAPVNYACIFSQSYQEFEQLSSLTQQIGRIIKQTTSGPLFHTQPINTFSGTLRLLKIRQWDVTRPERGDADFTVTDYTSFKDTYASQPYFAIIERSDYEMIELVDPSFNVRVYFSSHPLDQELGIF